VYIEELPIRVGVYLMDYEDERKQDKLPGATVKIYQNG